MPELYAPAESFRLYGRNTIRYRDILEVDAFTERILPDGLDAGRNVDTHNVLSFPEALGLAERRHIGLNDRSICQFDHTTYSIVRLCLLKYVVRANIAKYSQFVCKNRDDFRYFYPNQPFIAMIANTKSNDPEGRLKLDQTGEQPSQN